MPYDPSDGRSALKTATEAPIPQRFAGAEYVKFYELDPVDQQGDARTWWARGQNMVIGFTDVVSEFAFRRDGQTDEYVVLFPDRGMTATFTVDGEETEVTGKKMVVVPPGDSEFHVRGEGRVICLLTPAATDLAAKAANAESYDEAHPNVKLLEPWPEPVGGFKLRVYDLEVPILEKPPFRLYRCTTFMVNYFDPRTEPRSPNQLSPHHHDDFEQCSLVIEGRYVHHIRWPWGTDARQWREDDHELCAAPSVTIIPPPAVHTSQAMADGDNLLLDIFAPPRRDFSEMDGWVFNADDYPMSVD